MIAAVFDLDRTLLPGTTAERLFLRQLIDKRVIGLGSLVRTASFAVRTGIREAVQEIRAHRPYLTGVHEATLMLHGRTCARDVVFPMISPRGIGSIEWHQQQGHHTVLLSGSLPYIVDPLAEMLGIRHVISSRLETCKRRLTGRLRGLHPYGEDKARLIREHASLHQLDLARSYCYADHHTDMAMLSLFGTSVCVNPSAELRRIAEQRAWRIELFPPGL